MGGWFKMKITDFILIFIIITLPIFFIVEAKAENTKTFVEVNHHNDAAFTNATHDAINILRTNVEPKLQSGYDSYKVTPVNPQPAFDTFLQSLALNYAVENKISIDVLSRYVPVFSVVDYDGLLLNVYKPFKNGENVNVVDRVWLPKIPFSYSDDDGNVINFTIDEEVEVFDIDLQEWFSGTRTELLSEVTIPLLNDAELFDQTRRSTIVHTLQENLAYYINEHNVYTQQLDVTYKFYFPLIPQEDWYNTVDSISILTFFQGYPYRMADSVYHEYAFVGTRLDRTNTILAGTVDGEKRFWYKSCRFTHISDEIYSTKKQAAQAGYRELSCLNSN